MDVTLIYPGITECGFGSLKGNEGTWIHHGLAILSSALKRRAHRVDLLDLRRLSGWDEFRLRVRSSTSRAFGITMMSVDYNPATAAARIIKEEKPNAVVFVGGAHASICPDELLSLDCFDCILRGEGEVTFPKLIDSLEIGQPLPRLVEGQRLEDLDSAPWADRDLFEGMEEPFVPFLDPPFTTLIAGRGCRYNCSYCQPAEKLIFGHSVRRRSVSSIIDELCYLRDRFSFKSWMLHDDCLTEDPQWVAEFVASYRSRGFTQPFVCQSRSDLICKHPSMISSLAAAGLRLIIIGFESGSDRMLKFLRKGATRAHNLRAAAICRDNGVKIWANYMMGLPTETKDEVLETVTMLEKIQPYHCSPAFYTPHPGSDLFEFGKEMGLHLITNHDSYRRNTYDAKIKGPDYDFLKEMLYKSVALGEDAGGLRKSTSAHPKVYSALKRVKALVDKSRAALSGVLPR